MVAGYHHKNLATSAKTSANAACEPSAASTFCVGIGVPDTCASDGVPTLVTVIPRACNGTTAASAWFTRLLTCCALPDRVACTCVMTPVGPDITAVMAMFQGDSFLSVSSRRGVGHVVEGVIVPLADPLHWLPLHAPPARV